MYSFSHKFDLLGVHIRVSHANKKLQVHRGRERNGLKCYVCHCSICAIRHCPDTNIINTYFRENRYLDLAISKYDYLCTGCYNNHLDIIHENGRTSKDDELLKLMDDMSEHLPALELGEHSENIMESSN